MDEKTDRAQPQTSERSTAVSGGTSEPGGAGPALDVTTDLTGPPATDGSTPAGPERTELGAPWAIGRYRILRWIGQGGFGRIYLARDDELDRLVAIKVPNPERVASPDDVAAYLVEARTLAQLDHPNIVPVYDVGRTEDGHCYVVSKHIDGIDLSERMRRGRLTFRESAELVADVADALHHAHTRGLVHRDVKPANILLDAHGKPCVADFGLALTDADFGKGPRTAGTPSYMSPEQARGEGHRVDGRSDIFSVGVVTYELLTGRRPFRGESVTVFLEQIATTEPRPPRQVDDTIPRELERICLKALAKRASERYTTARDLADDLRHFLQTASASGSPATSPGTDGPTPAPDHEPTPPPPTAARSDSDVHAVKIIPKGLRSFDEHDADFFLELLPGPRDRDHLPESIRFWKTRIETTNPDKTFRVGLIYGPSGSGKSSLVKAGLLPRLATSILPAYIEATPVETEPRLLRALHRVCSDLPGGLNLVDTLAALRRGRGLRSGQKVLLVIDQFEQWLVARRGEEKTELVVALRQCDGAHVQAIVMVRDDFWLAASRFMGDLEVDLEPNMNIALVDLFDPRHARTVLAAFGRAYGCLPEGTTDLIRDQNLFLDRAITGLAQDGRVISVRLALFAEMVKGKPWSPATLREVGGTEGVGLSFLEETFSSPQANPKHRLHRKAAQSVLKALLPRTGTDIRGQMRSEAELREASGYAGRPRAFDDLIRILDPELRLITPTDPAGSPEESQSAGHYYQLTHDYLVHSLRDWLTRKLRETRRGRAELRLAERSSLWDARRENRYLPSVVEWVSIRALTRPKDWTDPQRRMMRRTDRVHGLRGLALAVVAAVLTVLGLNVRNRVVEDRHATTAAGLVQQLFKADTAQVPEIVEKLSSYRRWTDPELIRAVEDDSVDPRMKLHASLALLPVDAAQVPYLETQLLASAPAEVPVLRSALRPHQAGLTPKLWSALESATPGEPRLLTSASALAFYDPENPRWDGQGGKVAQALVKVNSLVLGLWLDALRPVRGKLTGPLATIFRDKQQSETVRSLATDILYDYAGDDPALLAALLMAADPKSYLTLFPVALRQADRMIPDLQAELAKIATADWRDPPLDQTWTKPDAPLIARIEAADGLVSDRFAFCQTLPLDEFPDTDLALRPCGYRPIRLRPYADGQAVRAAVVWTRDGRKWRAASGLTSEQIRQQDEKNRAEAFLPVDVVGYVATDKARPPTPLHAALWVEKIGDDDSRLYVGTTADLEAEVHEKLKEAKLIPRTQHVMIASDGRTRYSGVWGRPPRAAVTSQWNRDQFEGNLEQSQPNPGDQLLLDLTVSAASQRQPARERAHADLQSAEKKLETAPADPDARLARGLANFLLGENQKALDDLRVEIGKNPAAVLANQYRVIALARLGKKQEALTELAKFQKDDTPERSGLYLAAVVAAELGEGADKAFEALENALQKHPQDGELRYDAARAYALASRSIARSDKSRGRQLEERCIRLLREAVQNHEADFGKMDGDPDLDTIRDDPAVAEIMTAGHAERRYAGVWSSDSSFAATPIHGLDSAAHLRKCRELIAQGYRPVSWSACRTTNHGSPVTASVWHRPVVNEEDKDRLAERQSRAAIALIRMGKTEGAWSRLGHSPDPRLRSFIVNSLSLLGADPRIVAAELDRIGPGGEAMPLHGQQKMDAILFHPETSIRRALILALGTYGTDGLSLPEREPLVAKLLELYRHDPDAGIHGAAEWALRQWKQQDKLKEMDGELMKVTDWGVRQWRVNGQGQTYAMIDGPVQFRIGSPPTEMERIAENETQKRMLIPRRLAIAAKEVTVEQFQRFLRSKPNHRYAAPAIDLDRYSPDPDGPWINADWYIAADYCNWLSDQEGLSKDEWCYLPNAAGACDEGMSIPADVLDRTGYRLPTDAEWEYACRSGTLTSRYYGVSTELLAKYAWYLSNSRERAWTCGSLQPNDLGLFDMLGNVFEWCQDSLADFKPMNRRDGSDIIHSASYVSQKNNRLLRGGSLSALPANVRSANRDWIAPSVQTYLFGFRPVRTCR